MYKSLSERAAFSEQGGDITHSPAHPSARAFLVARQNKVQCTIQAGSFRKATRWYHTSTRPFSFTTEQSAMHYQGGRLSQSKPVISHIHQSMCTERTILTHSRTESNTLSERVAFTKQVRGIAQPSAHVLCSRTGHNPHTGRAAFAQ